MSMMLDDDNAGSMPNGKLAYVSMIEELPGQKNAVNFTSWWEFPPTR
ncbi:MAG: hypothetical protein ABIU10_01790 [Sphingomicrobium sp.]